MTFFPRSWSYVSPVSKIVVRQYNSVSKTLALKKMPNTLVLRKELLKGLQGSKQRGASTTEEGRKEGTHKRKKIWKERVYTVVTMFKLCSFCRSAGYFSISKESQFLNCSLWFQIFCLVLKHLHLRGHVIWGYSSTCQSVIPMYLVP